MYIPSQTQIDIRYMVNGLEKLHNRTDSVVWYGSYDKVFYVSFNGLKDDYIDEMSDEEINELGRLMDYGMIGEHSVIPLTMSPSDRNTIVYENDEWKNIKNCIFT